MEICDITWLTSSVLKFKEKIWASSSDHEIQAILDELFRYEEIDDIEFNKEIYFTGDKAINNILTKAKKDDKHSLISSPHNLRLLICHLIDTMLLNHNIFTRDINYPYYSFNSNKLVKLDLFPNPYICCYKIFLYLYRLKIISTEKLCYHEWSSLLSKLNLFIEKHDIIAKISNRNSFDSTFHEFLNSELKKFISTNEGPPRILNILQNKLVFGNFSKFSVFLKGLNLLKAPEMKKLGEQYLIKSISMQSLSNTNYETVKLKIDKANTLQSDQLFQIYCTISLSVNSNDFRNSIKYIIQAEKLLKNLSRSSICNRVLIKIYILISKLYLLIYNVNTKVTKFCLSNSMFNKFDCLPYLIISTLDLIHSEILENKKFLTNEEQNIVMNHLSEYIVYLQSNYPALLTMKFVESFSSVEPSNSRYLYLNTIHNEKKSLNLIFPISNIFSFLKMAENNIENGLLEVHSIICWMKLIPNFLLCYSEINSVYYENIYNIVFLSQLADQVLHYIQILYSSNSEYSKVFPKVKVAELYLFISLYSYFAKDDTTKVTEFILLGSGILESCSGSFEACSIKCIFAYINLLIQLRSSDDISNIEPQLRSIIRNGKTAFNYIYTDRKEQIYKKKLVNLALIQAFTLLSLIKNDFSYLENEELNIHLQFEETETEKNEEYGIEDNIIISKYLSIASSLNNFI